MSLADAQAEGGEGRGRLQRDARRWSWPGRPTDEVVFFATGFETTAVATAAVVRANPPGELLHPLGAQVHPARHGDRGGDAGDPRRGLPRRRATPPPSPAGASSSRSSRATGSRWWSPASSRSTSWPAWSGWSSSSGTGARPWSNMFPRCVTREGNRRAQEELWRVFRPAGGRWRGIAHVPNGNLRLRDEWAHLDARRRFRIDLAALWDDAPAALVGRLHLRRHHVGPRLAVRLHALRQGVRARRAGRRVHGLARRAPARSGTSTAATRT